MLTLDNFQDTLDNAIVQRGWRYFNDGLVHNLHHFDDTWTANVSGSYEYEVEVTIDENRIISTLCDCPYDWGPHCKHIVAVLYSIRGDLQSDSPKAKKAKRTSGEVRQLVEALSHTELVEIVMQQVKKDRTLGNQLTLLYSKAPPDKQAYVAIINDALHSHSDHGFLDYMGSMRAGRAVWEVMNQAIEQIDAGESAKAIPILQAVIETVAPVLEQADDSNGDLGSSLEEAIGLLEKAAEFLPNDKKRQIFDYALKEAFESRHEGFDNNWSLLYVAGQIATPQDRETFFAACDRMVETVTKRHRAYASSYPRFGNDNWYERYANEQAQRLKQDFMQRAGDSPQVIEAFLLENKHLDDSRQQLIQFYIKQERYAEAQDLCNEGIKAAEDNRYRGLVIQYRELLLVIARKQGDTPTVITLAESLFINSADFNHYEALKEVISQAEWAQYVEKLITKLSPRYREWGSSVIGEIYRREEMWEQLRDYVIAHGIHALQAFRADIEKQFPDTAIAVYKETVYNSLKQSGSRDVYRQMTDYLRRIKQLGQPDTAHTVAADLKQKYNNRPAMIDELNRL